ncbi:MAG TPA: hypothetical protein VK470_15915 [Bacteroidota bacterium]|nr:hypothetical protein [Bacteroidota bacterium]
MAILQAGDILPLSNVTFIPLPVNSLGRTAAKTVVSHTVTVAKEHEADVPFGYNYWADTKIVTVRMNLHFEAGSVSEATEVCVALDLHSFIVSISPDIDHFRHDVRFNVQAGNLDLSLVPDGAAVYLFHLIGSQCEIVPADALRIDKAAGTLTLVNARLSHFSIYAFGFTK